MLTFPLPLCWAIDSRRLHDFANICPVCLKVWAVCGEGKRGFNIERVPCVDCAYTDAMWHIRGTPGSYRVESSILDQLTIYLNETLTRRLPGVGDIMAVLPAAVIQHEFVAHLKDFEWISQQEVFEDEQEHQG